MSFSDDIGSVIDTGNTLAGYAGNASDVYKSVSKVAPGLTSQAFNIASEAVSHVGAALNIANNASQLLREDGMEHKLQRAGAIAVNIGTDVGLKALIGAAEGGGTLAAGGGLAAGAASLAPAAAVAFTTYEVGKLADATIDLHRARESVREADIENAKPVQLQAQPLDRGTPDISRYPNLAMVAVKMSPGGDKEAKIEAMKATDFSDPAKLKVLEASINARIDAQKTIIADNSSSLPNFMRILGDGAQTQLQAEARLAPLEAAKAELAMFKQDIAGRVPDSAYPSVASATPAAPAADDATKYYAAQAKAPDMKSQFAFAAAKPPEPAPALDLGLNMGVTQQVSVMKLG